MSLAIGEVVRRVLMSRLGVSAAERIGRPELATYEGASAASKEAKRAVGVVRSLVEAKPPAEVAPTAQSRLSGWLGAAGDASEMLLAAGTLLKTVSDFAREDAKLRRRVSKTTERGA